MLDCSIRSCFLSNQPLTVFPGHYVHLKISLQDVATVRWEKQIGSLLLRNAVEGNKLGKASPKLVQPLMTFSSISSWILAGIMTWHNSYLLHFVHHSFLVIVHTVPKWWEEVCVCGLYYVFAFIFESPKKKRVAYLIVPTCIGVDEHQAADQPSLQENLTLVWVSPGQHCKWCRKVWNNQCFKKKQKQAVLCCITLGEVRMNGARDKRQTNVTGHEPPLLSNEIKWQLLSEEGMLRERARERGVGGDFVRPGNWSHHKQIEFRSFWWARADQSIWPTTQCLSAPQKDTLASNNRSTVNNWSLGSVSFS